MKNIRLGFVFFRVTLAVISCIPMHLIARQDIIINGSFEAPEGYASGSQGFVAPGWNITNASPDLYSTDGSFGLNPDIAGNFTGVAAHSGLGWVAGWTFADEIFAQQLSVNLVPGMTYSLSAWMIQAKRSDLDNPGGYQIYLAPSNSLVNAQLVATLGATTNLDEWEFREETFSAPINSDSMPWILFRPYKFGSGEAYPGIDDVALDVVPQAVMWVGNGNGSWNDPGNWSTGQVPTARNAVVINDPNSSSTITIPPGSFAAASLESHESLFISAGATFSIGGNISIHNAIVDNSGLFQWSAAESDTQILLVDGSTLHNLPGGSMGLPGFSPQFNFGVGGNGQFINDGLLFVHSGSFNIAVGGCSSGTFEVEDGATLQFGGGYIFDQGTNFNGGGLVQLLAPTDPCRCTGDVTLDGLTVENSGSLELSPLDGTANLFFVDGATLNNLPGGSLGLPGFPPQSNFGFGGNGHFNNDGLLYVHSETFNIEIAVSSTGTFEVANGSTIQFNGGNSFQSGTTFDGGNGGGIVELGIAEICQFQGLMTIFGLEFYNFCVAELDPEGSVIQLGGGATFFNEPGGVITIPKGSIQSSIIGNGAFVNDGFVDVQSGQFDLGTGQSAGTFNVGANSLLQFDGGFVLGNGTALVGNGTVLIEPLVPPNSGVPPNPVQINGDVLATNMTVGSFGALNVPGSLGVTSGLNVLATGILSGTGTVSGNVVNAGLVLPGASPGRLTIVGDLMQTAAGELRIEIGGTNDGQFDQLSVDGSVALAGTLDVQLFAPFMLGSDQQFLVIDATGEITGQFIGLADEAFVENFGDTDMFINYDNNSVSLYTTGMVLLGDVNLDGAVNLLDISPFVNQLLSGMYQIEADITQDGVVNLLDVQPFVGLLSDG